MTLELAAIQHDIAWESPAETIAAVRPLVLDAAEQGATLISLTEMWACGFSMNTEVVAEAPDGRTATTMHELAEETGCWIAGSFPEHTAGHDRPTNRFLLAGPNGEDHRYSKTKPFSFAGETDHYDGGTPVEPIVVEGVRVTPFICYDLRFTDLFCNSHQLWHLCINAGFVLGTFLAWGSYLDWRRTAACPAGANVLGGSGGGVATDEARYPFGVLVS